MPDMDWRWGTVVGMIAKRRKVDATLRDKPHPEEWIGPDVWSTPEYLIYSVLRGIALLERDGMAQANAVRQVDARLRLNVLATGADAVPPEAYVVQVLRTFAPGYLDHGPALLAKVIAVARKGLRKLPEDGVWTTPDGRPPPEWRWVRVPQAQARKQFQAMERRQRRVPISVYDEEMADLLVRRQRGDQLWSYSSPRLTWRLKMARAGIVLVRKGRVLCDVTTRMN